MIPPRHPSQAVQRAKVGLIGLFAVIMLIGFASVIMRAVNGERPVAVVGASQPDVVANMAVANLEDASSEPLADLGVTSSSTNAFSPQTR